MHTVSLTNDWSLWKWFALRGAGFAADRMEQLAASTYARATDRWLARLELLQSKLAELVHVADGRDRKRVTRALEAVQALKVPEPVVAGGSQDAVAADIEQLRRTREDLDRSYQEAYAAVGRSLRATVGDARFREALTWQNRRALQTGMDPLVRAAADRADSKTRQYEQLVASYLQRYCTKNDHIGFFGPVGFGTLSRDDHTIRFQPGRSLLAQRRVYFEHWCIAALADKLSEDVQVKRWIAPRMQPTIRLEGEVVHHSGGASEVPPEFTRALALCDGVRSAATIAGTLVADDELGFSEEDEVLAILEQLEQQGLVIWKLAIPGTSLEQPERWLRDALEQIADRETRDAALAQLDRLEQARTAIERAAGHPQALEHAVESFATTFKGLTGADDTRNAGRSYAGRTLFYEDCRRDIELDLGAGFLNTVGPALGLVLQSARWYTATVAERYRCAFRELYEELAREQGSPTVEYMRFGERVDALLGTQREPHPWVMEIVARLQGRWRELLAFADGDRRVSRTSAELAPHVATAFAARAPGWPMARFHSPDLAIAARSSEAFARGEYLVVLGELHSGVNTISTVLRNHPDPQPFVEAYERDIPHPRIETVSRARTSRTDIFSPARHDFDVEIGSARSTRDRDHVIAVAQLVVEARDDKLVVRTRDGAHVFDIVAYHERLLSAGTGAQFRILAPAPHTPRVVVDSLVISREQWTLPPDTLPFAHAETAPDRFHGARRWALQLGLPRYVFYKVPEEPKPCFLDLDSPILVEIFAKQVRKALSVMVSEMLPAIDELWLADADGNRYTSELRTTAVDREPWQVP